eukprot:scaffold9750_cov116-Isochrysis_galbana.AAC.7
MSNSDLLKSFSITLCMAVIMPCIVRASGAPTVNLRSLTRFLTRIRGSGSVDPGRCVPSVPAPSGPP